MKKPDEWNFKLTKLKQQKNGGLTVEWQQQLSTGDAVTTNKIKQTSNDIPHPDLTNVIKDLHVYANEILQTDVVLDVTRVAVSGEDENRGVLITCIMDSKAGLPISLNTHRVKIADEIYGWEAELDEKIDKLNTEAFEYIYNGKQAQLEMFDEQE